MNRLKYSLIISLILFLSCGKEEVKYNIPDAPVSFVINTNALDTHLAGGGNVGIYIRSISLQTTSFLALINGYSGKDALPQAVEYMHSLLGRYMNAKDVEIVYY